MLKMDKTASIIANIFLFMQYLLSFASKFVFLTCLDHLPLVYLIFP